MTAEPNKLIEDLKRRYDGLKSDTERANAESKWEQIAEVISPRKQGFSGQRTPGDKRMQKVYDPTGIAAARALKAHLHGSVTNPTMRWGVAKFPDEQLNERDDVQEWSSVINEKFYTDINRRTSGFTTAVDECYDEAIAFGNGIIFNGMSKAGNPLYQARSLSECVFAEDSEGVVNELHRCTEYTISQLVGEWGLDKVSEKVREQYAANKLDEKVKVIHSVYPRKKRDPAKKDAANMEFMSCYFEHDAAHELEQGGFPEFPYIVLRWSKVPGETYGRGPGEEALPDVRMLQAMALTFIKTMQKNADPPIFVPDDGVIGPVRTVPGGLNFYRGAREIQMFPTSIQGLQALREGMEDVRNRIRTTFHNDVLSVADGEKMTATEVVERSQRTMLLLGPLHGRLLPFIGQIFQRWFGLRWRAGELPEPPDAAGMDSFEIPEIELVSPIATAQKQRQAEGLLLVSQHLIQMFGPELGAQALMKRVDPDRAVDWLWSLFNNDPDLLMTEDETAEAEQADQMQQMAALADPMAGAAQKGAAAVKSLTEASGANGAPAEAPAMANGSGMLQ